MKESPFGGLSYVGQENENVTINITATSTVQMVTYTINGAKPIPLHAGQAITLILKKKTGNEPKLVQINFDFSNKTGGNYKMVTKSVEGYPNNESPRNIKQFGSNPDSRTFIFDVL